MPKRKIHWTKKATQQFNEAINYIRLDSDKRADKVKNTLLEKITKLSRIVYYAGQKEVFIIRIQHTSMNPKRY